MQITPKKAIEFMSGLIEVLDKLKDYTIEVPVEMTYNISNTGLVDKVFPTQDMYREFEDLGGRSIDIHIDIPNYKAPQPPKE